MLHACTLCSHQCWTLTYADVHLCDPADVDLCNECPQARHAGLGDETRVGTGITDTGQAIDLTKP